MVTVELSSQPLGVMQSWRPLAGDVCAHPMPALLPFATLHCGALRAKTTHNALIFFFFFRLTY